MELFYQLIVYIKIIYLGDEVKSKDYEGKDRPEAPAGQEWAKSDK